MGVHVESRRLPFRLVEALGIDVCRVLRPFARRVEVAGSVRRRSSQVSDLEICLQPREVEYLICDRERTLFGVKDERAKPVAKGIGMLMKRLENLLGCVLKLKPNGNPQADGPKFKKLVCVRNSVAVPIDLFIVLPPAEWGPLFTIRTGPAEFSKLLVTPRASGGARPDDLLQEEGALWRRGGQRVPCDREEQYFEALGVPYIAPEKRSATELLRVLRGRPRRF